MIVHKIGRYADAEPLVAKCLELSRKMLGENHPDTLSSISTLALLYKIQGEIIHRLHILVSRSHYWIFYTGRYADAEPLYKQCLELRRTELGEKHPSTLASMSNLVELYLEQGGYNMGYIQKMHYNIALSHFIVMQIVMMMRRFLWYSVWRQVVQCLGTDIQTPSFPWITWLACIKVEVLSLWRV